MSSKKSKKKDWTPPPLIQVQIRISEDLKERVLEYRKKKLFEEAVDMSFSMAVRSLVEKGLKAS